MDVNKLLSYEYFGLLTDEETEGVNSLRGANKLPAPYAFGQEKDPQENLNAFKELINSSAVGDLQLNLTDEEYADLFSSTQKLNQWFEKPENRAMVGATVGGVVLPTLLPGAGPATLPARIVALINKYPRMAKVFAAITGGFGGSAPFIEADSAQEFIQQAGKYGLIEGVGEGAIQTIAKFFPLFKDFIKSRVKKFPEKGAEEAIEQGVILSPAQSTSDRIVDTIQNIADNSWSGGGTMAQGRARGIETATENIGNLLLNKLDPKVTKVLDNSVEDFVANASGKDFAGVMQNFLKNGRLAQDIYIDQAYKNLDKAVAGTIGNAKIVDISGLKKYVMNLQKDVPTDSTLATVYKQIADLPDYVDFTYAKNLRSMFLGNTKAFQETGIPVSTFSTKVSGAAFAKVNKEMENAVKAIADSHANKLINEGMDEVLAKEAGQKLFQQLNGSFRSAQDFFSLSKDTFNGTMVSKIINAAPDRVYNMLLKSRSPNLVKSFNQLLDQAVKDGSIKLSEKLGLKKQVQGEFFAKILTDSLDQGTGIVNASKLFQQMRTFGGTANRALIELFDNDPGLLKDFRSLTRSLQLAQSKGMEGANGGFLIQLLSAGALGEVVGPEGLTNLGWGDAAAFGLIFGGPKAVADAFTNPNFIKNIFKVNKLKPGSDMYTRAVVQTVSDLVEKNFISNENVNDFIDEGVQKNYLNENAKKYFENKTKKQGTDNSSTLVTSPEELEAKADLLKQLDIQTLDDDEPLAVASLDSPPSRSVSMAPLDLGPLTAASAPPSQSINPETIASLDSVGLPFFQAKDGGLASIEQKKFKKPQVVS
jgi:hypothetical protein